MRISDFKGCISSVHLYIDSFDEGLGLDSARRETLIKEYKKELFPLNEKEAATKLKLLVSCRTDYLENESNYKWFTPQVDAFDKLLTVYITPIDYNGHANLKEMIGVYAKHNSKDVAFVDETKKDRSFETKRHNHHRFYVLYYLRGAP